ncbi:MAG: cysteine dioxygenase [Proteobacteria bacterium]|nr:cysteine dioxygenase [Pseudomonadota bacterium]
MTTPPDTLKPLREFVGAFATLLDGAPAEPALVVAGSRLLAALVARDDWLPPECAQPDARHYQQYLLHVDPQERFSVVSFVWGPGQATPVHNHTVWGLIGVLRGAEFGQAYAVGAGEPRPLGPEHRLEPGQVEAVSPTLGDVHRVRNAFDDRVSISIHVYGGNIGTIRRSVFAPDGTVKDFVSGYANARPPELGRD